MNLDQAVEEGFDIVIYNLDSEIAGIGDEYILPYGIEYGFENRDEFEELENEQKDEIVRDILENSGWIFYIVLSKSGHMEVTIRKEDEEELLERCKNTFYKRGNIL
jgi:hypothetical protein